jgi:glutamine synthetase
MLLAGIDGIVRKINPENEGFGPYDKNIVDYSLKDKINFLPRNLEESLDALEIDNEFLKRDNIFSDEVINQWFKIKQQEINSINTMPHPFEYKMYFTL